MSKESLIFKFAYAISLCPSSIGNGLRPFFEYCSWRSEALNIYLSVNWIESWTGGQSRFIQFDQHSSNLKSSKKLYSEGMKTSIFMIRSTIASLSHSVKEENMRPSSIMVRILLLSGLSRWGSFSWSASTSSELTFSSSSGSCDIHPNQNVFIVCR